MVITEPMLLPTKAPLLDRSLSHMDDELRCFRSCLWWLCIDQSDTLRCKISFYVHIILAIQVPLLSHFVLSYSERRRPYESVVQLSLTTASSLSFICLNGFFRKYGLRRFMFLDKLRGESRRVQDGYVAEINRSFRIIVYFLLPCFIAECGYKAWWYYIDARKIPFLGNPVASDIIACILELASWIYRRATFLLVCIIFHVICHLQILHLQDFATIFQEESDVAAVLRVHLKIRRQLGVTSKRFCKFIVVTIILVTSSQFATVLLTTRQGAEDSLFNIGELVLCSIGLVMGLMICLRSAAKITHKAQEITSHAAKWHVCATIDLFEPDPENLCESNCILSVTTDEEEYDDSEATDEDELDDTEILYPHAHTISFQKRQALVTYLENNTAGITISGFMLDRRNLHLFFMIEMCLFLWLLGKTIGIS